MTTKRKIENFFNRDMNPRSAKSWFENIRNHATASAVLWVSVIQILHKQHINKFAASCIFILSVLMFAFAWLQSCFMALSLLPELRVSEKRFVRIFNYIGLGLVSCLIALLLFLFGFALFTLFAIR